MNRVFLGILIGILVLSIPVYSQELYQYEVNAEIQEDYSVHYEASLIFVNYTGYEFSFPIYGSPYNINVNTTANCSVDEKTLRTDLMCNFRRMQKNRIEIRFDYYSDEYVNKKGDYSLFSQSFRTPVNTTKILVYVILPEGTGLLRSEEPFSPKNAFVGSIYGRQTLIGWEREKFTPYDSLDISVAYETLGTPNQGYMAYIGIIAALSIAIVVGLILFYKFYFKEKGMKMIIPVLKKDEKIIFEAIMKHGSGTHQKIVVRESNYSKAKVSKVLKSLEERGLVKLERIGRSNKVHLVDQFLKKS